MELWLAALLFLLSGGLLVFLLLAYQRSNNRRFLLLSGITGAMLAALALYILFTFILVTGTT